MDINLIESKDYIIEKFRKEGDFDFLSDGDLERIVETLITADDKYMDEAGVYDGGVYDEDEAYGRLFETVSADFPEYKTYAMRLTEDYMDFAEEYLASIEAIEWE